MNTDIKNHSLAYVVLVIGLGLSVWLWLISGHNQLVRQLILLALMIWYPTWGYLVHRRSGQNPRALLREYVAVAMLTCGLVLLLTLF